MRLKVEECVVLVIDVQEKLVPSMYDANVTPQVERLVRGAQILGVPVLYSEQYPKGLGRTIPAIADLLRDAPRFEKVEFSCVRNEDFADQAQSLFDAGRRTWIVCGIESHICVAQTVCDWYQSDYADSRNTTVVVASDACASRTERNHIVGMNVCERAGARIWSVETILFALLQRAGSSEFKAISALVR